jgi:carboxypeptidase C (cathepsin A)
MAITIIVLSMAAARGQAAPTQPVRTQPVRTQPAPTQPATRPETHAEHPAQRPVVSSPTTGEDKISVTHHFVKVNGIRINYEAAAGTMMMKDEFGKPRANFFFVSYTKEPAARPEDRPITFVFNGGPGAAAVWLHLGAAGPKRIALEHDGIPGPPPHGLIDNDQTWLDVSDLVFIDPVGTGYSRPAAGQKASDFYGVQPDLESISEFIRLYLTRYERWDSPKFLAGESYGTTRAAALSSYLLDHDGIDLNGIILLSTVLNFQTLDPADGNDLPYALYLPSYTAIALYHHKLETAEEDLLLNEVQQYALHDYLDALARGGALTKDARDDVVAHLARYTGLPPELIDRANLRIGPNMFRKQLLIDQRLIIGRYDGRISGLDANPAAGYPQYDPSFSLYLPVYAGAFNDYVRRQLKYDSDLDYKVLSDTVGPWDFGRDGGAGGYLDVTGDLRSAMLDNPNLKVLVCSGYEDLATPFLATKYTFDHLDLTDRLQSNVTQTFYHSGHMIYQDPAALRQLKQNVAAFITSATKPGG